MVKALVISIRVHIFGEGPTTLTMRLLPLMRSLESIGFDCRLVSPIKWGSVVGNRTGNIFSVLLTHPIAEYAKTLSACPDFVIISKTSTPQMRIFQKILKAKKVKNLFDLSDALFVPSTKLLGVTVRDASYNLEKIIKDADFVTTNGHYLLDFVREYNEKSTFIHDPIDCTLFYPKAKGMHDYIIIGWEGNPLAHYDNLSLLVKPLERLSCEYKLRLKLVSCFGDARVKNMFKRLEPSIDIDYGSMLWLPVRDFVESISEFDIMVAPIQKTAWYEGKSALRVGIGMAMGIPVVASPVGEQKYVVKHAFNGFIAKDEDDWYRYLKLLIENKSLRDSLSSNGRQTANNELSLPVCGNKLLRILAGLEFDNFPNFNHKLDVA